MVFSIHAPSRGESYSKQVNKLLDEIGRIAIGSEIIIGGDFNLTVSNSVESERSVKQRDLAIQARLADEFGLIYCWQASNPNQPLPQTLRWTRDRTIPYHCDGLFVPKSWQDRLESCVVLSGDDWNRLSDHNPVIAQFR
jgi:endonuclease/exonuclease/phosphatase family metal-dependent hydrolase